MSYAMEQAFELFNAYMRAGRIKAAYRVYQMCEEWHDEDIERIYARRRDRREKTRAWFARHTDPYGD